MHKVVDGHAWLHLVLLLQHHQLGVSCIKDLLSSWRYQQCQTASLAITSSRVLQL